MRLSRSYPGDAAPPKLAVSPLGAVQIPDSRLPAGANLKKGRVTAPDFSSRYSSLS